MLCLRLRLPPGDRPADAGLADPLGDLVIPLGAAFGCLSRSFCFSLPAYANPCPGRVFFPKPSDIVRDASGLKLFGLFTAPGIVLSSPVVWIVSVVLLRRHFALLSIYNFRLGLLPTYNIRLK